MTVLSLDFVFERSTKNTHRFAEQPPLGTEAAVGILYVQKSALKQAPATLKVTIEVPQ